MAPLGNQCSGEVGLVSSDNNLSNSLTLESNQHSKREVLTTNQERLLESFLVTAGTLSREVYTKNDTRKSVVLIVYRLE